MTGAKMLRRWIGLALLLAAGCRTTPWTEGQPDFAGVNCAEISSSVGLWLDGHRACNSDLDCVVVHTSCGLPAECGQVVAREATSGYLQSLVDAWDSACDPTPACPCPGPVPVAWCNQGRCASK